MESFLHHFYPAYDACLVNYSRKILDNKASVQEKLSKLPSFSESMNLNMNMNTDKKNDDYSSNESGIFSSRILLNDEWLP